MSVASFVAAQRTEHGVPHALTCRALELSESWFYKWRGRSPTPRQRRRACLDADVRRSFEESDGDYGSPRVVADLREWGWKVSPKTVAASMARQGLVGRPTRRRFRSLTRPDKAAAPLPDLVKRDFTARRVNQRWFGDGTEIDTAEGKLHLAGVLDVCSRRIVGFALSEHHDAELAYGSLAMAVAVRGGQVGGVVLHTDQGSEYTAGMFRAACARLGVRQSMGRPGSALDNAVIESWHSTLEFELRSCEEFPTKPAARRRVAAWVDEYNRTRRHSSIGMISPIDYELAQPDDPDTEVA